MRKKVSFGRIAMCLAVVAVISACSGPRHKDRFKWDEILSSVIQAKEATGNPTFLDVRRVMPFGWDAFYVFPPGTAVDQVKRSLGFDWGKAKDTGIDKRDDITLLVFVAGQTVQEHIEQPLSKGDFSRLKAAHPYTPDEAYFELVTEIEAGAPRHFFMDAPRPR
jgi:hypothetical protein